jgi:aryl-alcohol dehydrogenase-like predicted oxidoreductase
LGVGFSPDASSGSKICRPTTIAGVPPRFQGENFQKNLDLVAQVARMAKEKGCTPAQLALAWVLAQGDDIVPIPGTKRRKYLEENVGALNVELTGEDLRRLEEVFPSGAASGQRYPEHMMELVNR